MTNEQYLKVENTRDWLDEKHGDFYQFAILHVAWRVDLIGDQPHRRLIVAWIECFPIECTYAYELPECMKKTPHGNLFYQKIKLNMDKAIQWYRDVLKNKYLTMIWQKNEKIFFDKKYNSKVLLYNNPPFPAMTFSEKLPYTSNWGVTQNNHIFPEKIDSDMLDIIKKTEVNNWLKDRIFWDINEYLEYLGSVNLLLPNPIYSSLSSRLLPKKKNNNNEEVIVKLTMRKGQSFQSIKFYSAERIMGEFSNFKETTPDYAYFKIEMQGYAEENAYFVEHKNIGIIDYKPFLYFLRTIQLNIDIGDTERRVKLPNGKEITTKIHSPLSDNKVENNLLSEANCRNRFNLIRHKRSQKEAGEQFGQKIFYNEHENATDLVRQIIGSAKQNVIIIDPYFAVIETYEFALAATSTNIEIEIITGSDTLKKKVETSSCFNKLQSLLRKLPLGTSVIKSIVPNDEVGNKLKKHIYKIKQQDKSLKEISVKVMGGKAIFHDRFIIIDNKEVWFSGNSFNSIGKRVGAIIKLPNPNEMLEKLSQMRNEKNALIPLDVWLANRKRSKVQQ